VVVDFPVPLRSGGCLTAAIKQDPGTSHVPVIAYSGWNYPRTRATAREYGCAEFVARSADAGALVAAVERATHSEEAVLHA
jgi:CheY-like chemotaxis protein